MSAGSGATGSNFQEDYMAFVLAVDDLEWTKHWLVRQLRCDELVVFIARNSKVKPKVRIRAVESKATSKTNPVEMSAKLEPFTEGIGQVTATLDALWRIISPTGANVLVEDLRFSSFIEHLASVALSALHPILITDTDAQHVIRCISDLSSRTITPPEEVELDGAVVCTQYRGAASHEVHWEEIDGETRSWRIQLIRAGTGEIDRLLGSKVREELAEAMGGEEGGEDSSPPNGDSGPPDSSPSEGGGGSQDIHTEANTAQEAEDDADRKEGIALTEDPGREQGIQLARDLYLACLHRGFPVQEPNPEDVSIAPALLSVSMALRAGASIKPIESALDDLAREVGVPSISVENDPLRSFHLRFVIARRDRKFPSLPDKQAPLFERDSQSYLGMYLGSTIDGRDYNSFVSSWPHMLVGGTTGSGKTTFIRSLLRQMNGVDARYLKLAVVDGKGEIDYLGVLDPEHFVEKFPDVILGYQNVLPIFDWLVNEEIPTRREKLLRYTKSFSNQRPRSARELYVEAMMNDSPVMFPPIVVVVDEFAEIMIAKGDSAQQFEQRVQQITQVGRSILVHLLLATQRPDASVISGAIKANLDARVALRVPTFHDSMTILGSKGAERLTGRGDMIFQASGQPVERLQGYNA